MSEDLKKELIVFRLNRSEEVFEMAKIAVAKQYWNSAASDLYYTCFYLVIALFAKNDIKTSTHSGVRTILGSHFIKEGILDAKWGRLLSDLFAFRQKGDYGDFKVFEETEILPLLAQVEAFRTLIKSMLED